MCSRSLVTFLYYTKVRARPSRLICQHTWWLRLWRLPEGDEHAESLNDLVNGPVWINQNPIH